MCEDRGRDSKVVVASASNPLCEEGMWSRIDCGFLRIFTFIADVLF